MKVRGREHNEGGRAFLTRLARDKRGNVITVMAMSLIPFSALAGSAFDMARLYVVKVRLQQACDAGALAGRKFMRDNGEGQLDGNAKKHAKTFFENNFRSAWLGTTAVDFTPTKTSNNRVAGAATATVPMTLMKMFGMGDQKLDVTCEARFDIADTDIMFVLDTTGSMACAPGDDAATCSAYAGDAAKVAYTRPNNSATDVAPGYAGTTGWAVTEKGGSRIDALRAAVVAFYKTMDAAKQPTTRVRYGFVTYTSTVNAGAAIMAVNPAHMIGGSGSETWNYQSRRVTNDYVISEGLPTSRTYNAKAQASCPQTQVSRSPGTALTYNKPSGQASRVVEKWFADVAKCGTVQQTIGPVWTHESVPHEVSGYVTASSVTDPSKVTGANSTWLGCIEERNTTPGTTSFNVESLPPDLDPDLIPSSRDTRWRPLWPDVTYQRISGWAYRQSAVVTNGDDEDYNPDGLAAWHMNTEARQQSGNVSCGKPVQRLREMTESDVSGYVNAADFAPLGGTYHDVGMIWGLRLLSREGVFAADNQAQGGRDAPKRVIVFLTDGDMAPNQLLYGLYGMEYWDRRVANGDGANLKAYHNARFLAACNKARQMRIDVWTVALGTGKTTELTNCASQPDQALATTSGSGLEEQFKRIAKAVAMLRVSK